MIDFSTKLRKPLPPSSGIDINGKPIDFSDFIELDDLSMLAPAEDFGDDSNTPTEFLTGPGGSGKTYTIIKRIEEDPKYGVLAATTGIAAMNLGPGVVTINTLLGFYDTESLIDNFNRGKLATKLATVAKAGIKNLIIDEISMMDGRQLTHIVKALEQVNDRADMTGKGMGLILTGDFAQLPPVKAPFAFESPAWKYFAKNMTKLDVIHRQSDPTFIGALQHARRGEGGFAVAGFSDAGVTFAGPDPNFDGTTILSKNDLVDNFNFSRLQRLQGKAFGLKSMYWGETLKEWHKAIPPVLQLKEGAYVMILANEFSRGYVNGDCGTVVGFDQDSKSVIVRLARDGREVSVLAVTRYNKIRGKEAEDKFGLPKWNASEVLHVGCSQRECGHSPYSKYGPWNVPSYNCGNGSWNVGAVKYFPLKLAYATTCHKSQGLTLDRVQIDSRDHFFGSPGLAYVALSRVRTAEGLRIVGSHDDLSRKIKMDPRVERWI